MGNDVVDADLIANLARIPRDHAEAVLAHPRIARLIRDHAYEPHRVLVTILSFTPNEIASIVRRHEVTRKNAVPVPASHPGPLTESGPSTPIRNDGFGLLREVETELESLGTQHLDVISHGLGDESYVDKYVLRNPKMVKRWNDYVHRHISEVHLAADGSSGHLPLIDLFAGGGGPAVTCRTCRKAADATLAAARRRFASDDSYLADRRMPHVLTEVRYVPIRNGHEPLQAANPCRGFSNDELRRFVDGETVVPIVPLSEPVPIASVVREDSFHPAPFTNRVGWSPARGKHAIG